MRQTPAIRHTISSPVRTTLTLIALWKGMNAETTAAMSAAAIIVPIRSLMESSIPCICRVLSSEDTAICCAWTKP